MAQKSCSALDITLKWIGIVGIVFAIFKYGVLRYLHSHYQILHMDIARQLGL